MKQYLDVLKNILENGEQKRDRTGTGTISSFAETMKFDLTKGFPIVTTKKSFYKSALDEMLWMIRGEHNTNTLNSKIWDNWSDEKGNIGKMYGAQWRDHDVVGADGQPKQIDQLKDLIENIKNNPNSRRHIITTLNMGVVADENISPRQNVEKGNMALWPCHGLIVQFYCHSDNGLSCSMYQRSADYPIGIPFNIMGYALLTEILAKHTGRYAKNLTVTTGDSHIYNNQIKDVREQLKREPLQLPKLKFINVRDNIEDYQVSDFELVGYECHPPIKYKISI